MEEHALPLIYDTGRRPLASAFTKQTQCVRSILKISQQTLLLAYADNLLAIVTPYPLYSPITLRGVIPKCRHTSLNSQADLQGQPSTQWPPAAQPPFGAVPSQRRKAVPVQAAAQEQPGHQHGGGPASQAQYSPLLPDFELSSRASPAGGPGTQLQYSPIPPDPPQV